jgi:hypothetical protein
MNPSCDFFSRFYYYFLIWLLNLCYYFPKTKNYQQIYCLSRIKVKSNVGSPTKIEEEIDVSLLVQTFTCLELSASSKYDVFDTQGII